MTRVVEKKVSPGEGYRWVEVGEKLLPTDQLENNNADGWKDWGESGSKCHVEEGFRRRKAKVYNPHDVGSCSKLLAKSILEFDLVSASSGKKLGRKERRQMKQRQKNARICEGCFADLIRIAKDGELTEEKAVAIGLAASGLLVQLLAGLFRNLFVRFCVYVFEELQKEEV